MTFTNATFTFIGQSAGSMTGSIEYHFDDTTGAATAAVMVNITKTAGCCAIGGGNYYFNAPGHTNNLTVNSVQFLTTSNRFQFNTSAGFDSTGTPNGPADIFLDVTGTGSSATVALFDPNNHNQTTCSGVPGNNCFALATIGTNVGMDLAAPEPASLAVLGVGLAAVGAVRRRRLAAQVR
ncbi:MAG: PEP-CTERM sorting domain-containing protein [Rhodospirillales bacterium]